MTDLAHPRPDLARPAARFATLAGALDRATDQQAFELDVARVLDLDLSEPTWPQLDAVERALLLRTITSRRPNVPLDPLQSATSLADVYEWSRPLGDGSDGAPSGARPRPADAAIATALVHLREWRHDDLPALYAAAVSPDQGRSWRLRGATPSFRQFASDFGAGTLATLVVARNTDDVVVGTVAAYSPSLENGWVYIGFQGIEDRSGIGVMLEGMFLFVTWLFDTWNLRKVYAEVSPLLFERIKSLGPDVLHVAGRLEAHVYMRGTWDDVVLCSIDRDAWQELVSSIGQLVGYQAAAPAT